MQLDVLLEDRVREELQAELAEPLLDEEEVARVDDLRPRHVDVDDAEVLLQAVPEELAAEVEQDPDLLVRDLEGDEVVSPLCGNRLI